MTHMPTNYTLKTEYNGVLSAIAALSNAIMEEMVPAIGDAVDAVKSTVTSQYSVAGPPGFTTRTGALRASITSYVTGGYNKVEGVVVAGTYYDQYVELLWSGKYSYMLPALMDNEGTIYSLIEEGVNRGASKI